MTNELADEVRALDSLVRRMFLAIKILTVVVLVVSAVVVVLEIQVARRNNMMERVDESATRAQVASDAAYKLLDDAIRTSRGNAPNTAAAIDAIHRIEEAVQQVAEAVGAEVNQGGAETAPR